MRKRLRPKVVRSITVKQTTGHGAVYVTITYKRARKPFEVFINLGKTNPCERASLEALSRCISVGLRYGVPVNEYIEQLRGISCHPIPDKEKKRFLLSPADSISSILEAFVNGS